ncbi:hypothetical protein [Flavobacterium sp. 102]|uniref:hypothetical protein n=1 Tax=Flavobacterium sp. 102 TaxID=2135623 RepID=UPI000EAE4A02|nr:hypothetical protein [Flavobacterium sp. 102]RKS03196.1 hypothetical protein C8C84_2939 [Flavobacterium sp. 102]
MCDTAVPEIDFFKVLAVVSPFISAFLAGLLTYYFTLKTKKFDILYQNKIPAFKEIALKLIELKKFCLGRSAYYQGNEFSPYWEENLGALEHRTAVAEIFEINSIFLSKSSKKSIENLISEMSGLCNAEISIAGTNEISGVEKEYERIAKITEETINILYSDLNLKS